MKKTMHLKIDVKGLLLSWDRFPDQEKMVDIFKDDGKKMTTEETKAYLERELKRGRLYLPMGDCDNFDYKKGCLGHPVEPVTVRKIVEKYLKDNGFDGLFEDECGCQLSDLAPCSCESIMRCEPGYKHEAKEGDENDFYIRPDNK